MNDNQNYFVQAGRTTSRVSNQPGGRCSIMIGGWTEEELLKFAHSREGHLRWCDYVDSRHGKAFFRGSYVNDEVKALMEQVPCALDWYRWVEWHNRAIEATQAQGLLVHYLY